VTSIYYRQNKKAGNPWISGLCLLRGQDLNLRPLGEPNLMFG
jgi:hypothetical protein